MKNDIEMKVHEAALKRRAGWLEVRMSDDRSTGKHYDRAEYAALLWAMSELGIKYEAGEGMEQHCTAERLPVAGRKTGKPWPRDARDEEPPKLPGEDATFVPGEPKGRRYYPNGL